MGEYILAALVEHKPGVLHKVSNMFRKRNFNIESITVGACETGDIARMTITVQGDEATVEQVVKQLQKLVDVIKVSRLEPSRSVVRELALVKVYTADSKAKSDVINYATIFRGRIVDVSRDSMIIEITGSPTKIDAFVELVKSYGIKEFARTGVVAMSRGLKSLKVEE
ncbi:MAG: acetolactate synthase small subunit [Candidatus Bathyarchaeia archaeon]